MGDYIPSLEDAALSDNKVGALQQVLSSRTPPTPQALQQRFTDTVLSRMGTPAQTQQLSKERQSGLEQYQAALLSPANGTFTPTEQAAYTWVGNMGKTDPWNALTSGIAAGGKALSDNQLRNHNGLVAAAQAGYEDAVSRDKLDVAELAAMRGLIGRTSLSGGAMEKVLPLYGRLFNSFSQQAKDIQFNNPAERAAWIRNRTDESVSSALEQFGVTVTPSALAQLHSAASVGTPAGTSFASTVDFVQPADKQRATRDESSTPPPTATEGSNTDFKIELPGDTDPDLAHVVINEFNRNVRDFKNAATPEAREKALANIQLLQTKYGTKQDTPVAPKADDSASRGTFAQRTPPGTPPFVNKPNEKMMQTGAAGMGTEYAKDYGVINEQAAAAKDQFDAYTNLEKIDPNTNAFANVQGYIGLALQGLGVDPKTPIIQDAMKNRQADVLIKQMSNAALRGEKGVQTRSDEVRIGNELAKTTDPKQVWRYLIQLGKERANRKMELGEFASKVAADNNGVPIAARQKYIDSTRDDPLTQEFNGRLIFRTPTIAAYLRKYPDATREEAVNYWRSLERNWTTGQGRKQ